MKFFRMMSLLLVSSTLAMGQSADTNLVMMYFEHAGNLMDSGEYNKALLTSDSAFLLQKLNHKTNKREYLLSQRGEIFFNLSSYDSAVSNLLMANNLMRDKDISRLYANNSMLLGACYGKLGERSMAVGLLDEAITEFIALKEYEPACEAINRKGLIYYHADEYDSAMAIYLECIFLANKNKLDKAKIKPLINISNIYNRTEEYDKALETLNQAIGLCRNDDSKNRSTISQNIASVWIKKGEYDKALKVYEEAIELAEQTNNLLDIAFLKSNSGIIYYSRGKYRKALEYMRQTSEIFEKLNEYANLAHALNDLAVIYNKLGEIDNAIKSLEKSIEVAKKMNSKSSIARAYKNIAQIYKGAGNYKQAYESMDIYRLYRDSIFQDKKIKYLSEQQVKFDKLQDETKIVRLENEKVKAESQNKTLKYKSRQRVFIFIIVIIVLVSIILFYIWKIKKNKIISEQRFKRIESERKFETAKYVIQGEEKERKRIAQELHDGIGVLLSTASIHFSNVEDKVDKGISEIAAKAKDLLNEASSEIRTISHNMMPSVLSKFGLYEALSDIFESLDEDSGISAEFEITGEKRQFDENTEIMIFRFMQELVNNTIKHANASMVHCKIVIEESKININYSDNGIGFDEKSVDSNSSFGLNGINSRVDLLNGRITNNSRTGKGTSYHIELPI
jgi:signal transduction histidine kinase